MLKAFYKPYKLQFTRPVLTSRGEMKVKNGYYLFVTNGTNTGVGECSFIEGLSIDDLSSYEHVLQQVCIKIQSGNKDFLQELTPYPSIKFGYETALLDLETGGRKILFPSAFTSGGKKIAINGLVWMGKKDFMQQQIEQKLQQGYKCIKIKVGAIGFDEELALLKFIRAQFPPELVEIRLDANGAFSFNDVFEKLDALSAFSIHSIEQPIKQGHAERMKAVCAQSPIPVALDEELIGVYGGQQENLLDKINPKYIILKPSLLGGFAECNLWAAKAEAKAIQWWATSALESNIGLNAIAQWVATKSNSMVQGLGTGGLYTNNVSSPLYISQGTLGFEPQNQWDEIL
ncbi:MAG TPA: o-succinylbenzoate synthase [Chitinophagales bacterium]|nr:o-succinylbenzoate synthase [Chitinophagales bacterium]